MTDTKSNHRPVLVVEDDTLIAATMEIALESRGYATVGPAATLEAAIQLLATSDPGVALIDYRLETGTSEGLLPLLRERNIPTCVLTGVSADMLPAAYAHCMVLQKPFRLKELIDTVEKLGSPTG